MKASLVLLFALCLAMFAGLGATNFICLMWAPRAWQRGFHVSLGVVGIMGVFVSLLALLNVPH